MKHQWLFGFGPYASIVLLALGLLVRHLIARRKAAAAHESRVFRAPKGATRLWRATLAALFAAHLAGMLTPRLILAWNGVPLRLYVLEGSGFAIGIVALIGFGVATWRHLSHANTSVWEAAGDSLFLSVTLLATVTGLLTAYFCRWGSNWSVVTVTPYIRSLARDPGSIRLITSLPFVVRLHVVSAFAAAALLPISSIAPLLLAVLTRPLAWLSRPFEGGWRRADSWARRHSPAAWIWPEED